MINIRSFHLLSLLIIVTDCVSGFSGEIEMEFRQDSVLEMADNLMEIGNYDEAITEYRRFIFFNTEDDRIGLVYEKIGEAYRNLTDWPNSIEAYRQSIFYTSNDSIIAERNIEIAIVHLSSGNPGAAEFELLRVFHFNNNAVIKRRASYFLGVCHLYVFKWENALTDFNFYFENPDTQINQLEKLISEAKNPEYKSPELAKWLSIFIPGTGFFYLGDWRNGINALALNGLLVYLCVDAAIERRFADIILGYSTFIQRYYQGHVYNTKQAAISYNQRLNKIHLKKILNYLEIQEQAADGE